MSYELTRYRTFSQHEAGCGDCTKLRPPTNIHVPTLQEELRRNRLKRNVTDRKVKDIAFTVADLERRVREATREGRVDFKFQLTYRLSMTAGYLHMLLRYSLLLKQDNRRLQYLLSQAGRSGPLPTLNFMDAVELDMASSAPDVGALLMYDFYSPMRAVEEEQAEEEGEQEEDEEEGPTEYSIITELFAALNTN